MKFPLLFRCRRVLILLLLWSACLSGTGKLMSAPADGPPPTREQIETQVKGLIKAWETGDADAFAAALHEKLLFAYPGDRLDRAELIELFKNYHQEKKDIKIYFGRFFVQDNRFAMTYQFAATDRASGKRQAVGTAAVGRIEDGKIILLKEYYDEHVARRQAAGEIPLDEGQVFPYPASIMLVPSLIN